MDKGKMHYLIGIVYQYGGSLIVSDWELKVRGGILTHIFYNENADILQFFNGDMEDDEYAEEVFPTEEELEEIFKEVTDNFLRFGTMPKRSWKICFVKQVSKTY